MAFRPTLHPAKAVSLPRSGAANLARPFKGRVSNPTFLSSHSDDGLIMEGHHVANTYTSLHYHVIFSTKNREPWITPDIEQRIWKFIGGIARGHDMTALQVGGVEDHIHALLSAPPTIAPSQIAQLLKGVSSKWIHEEFPSLKNFRWQDGYGAFTVSKSNIPEVIEYIQNQREHHRTKTFQEEYLEFLKANGIQYDERYLWG